MEINYSNRLITSDLIICPNLAQVMIGNAVTKISPVNMKVLMLLIKNQGKVVSRNQLFDEVWTNQEVSDDTLTRCISDLRAQLGKDHIQTLPKRGYQWMPNVTQYNKDTRRVKANKLIPKVLTWIIIGIVGMFILSTFALWVANKIVKPEQIRVALLPMQFKLNENAELASNIERVLKDSIIRSEKLKLLSTSVANGSSGNPFPKLNRDYSIQWIIEGQIDNYNNQRNLTLSLVDARTALVMYSLTSDNNTTVENLFSFSQKFVNQIPN